MAVVTLELAVFNFAQGGLVGGINGSRRDHDFSGLVEAMQGDWPDLLVLCEGAFYTDRGNAGAFAAATAMREAGGRAYMPLPGSLPGNDTLAPVLFADPQTVVVHRFHSGREPDHRDVQRNLCVASRAGSTERFGLLARHFDVDSGEHRLQEAQQLRRYGNPDFPCAIAGDFNSHPSGPHWTVGNFDQAQPHRRVTKSAFPPHVDADGNEHHTCDTRALDFLLGPWHEPTGTRLGGAGFWDAAELFKDYTPTVNNLEPGTFGPMTLDRVLVNEPWKDALTSYRVHAPDDPEAPPSDHRRITVEIDV
jgi:endonuclease/exonuclease/phosphatase family metal-dependent hydrolase